MKIRINNIFVNKAKNEKRSKEKKEFRDINEDINNCNMNISKNNKDTKRKNIKYKSFTLKKVYDSSDITNLDCNVNSKNEFPKETITSSNVENVNNYNKNSNIRRRKGYDSLKIIEKNGDEKKIKVYYDNLIKNKNGLKRGYYILLGAMIILGTCSIRLVLKTHKMFNTQDYEVFSNIDNETEVTEKKDDEDDIQLQSNETSNKDTINELEKDNKNVNASNQNQVKTISSSVENKVVSKVVPLNFSKPIDGDILKHYSIDKVIYSKTLELWKTHEGIDIKAVEGTYVKSIEKGTIEKVYEDSFYGITIVIDHGQGYKSSYSNLDKSTLVKEKQSVVKGQKIGKVGNTAIGEIKDESHIHFMLFKDGQNTDPTSIFK